MKRLILLVALTLSSVFPAALLHAATVPAASPQAVQGAAAIPDVNSAGIAELTAVRGIGPALAQRIVEYRTKNGPFRKFEDLLGVSGIGEVNLETFRSLLKMTPVK